MVLNCQLLIHLLPSDQLILYDRPGGRKRAFLCESEQLSDLIFVLFIRNYEDSSFAPSICR